MKLLVNFLLLLCVSQHVTAFIPWLSFRSLEEQNHAEIEDRSLICKLDAVLLACKVLGAQATTFCSSYLHISTATVVVPSISPTYVSASIFYYTSFLEYLIYLSTLRSGTNAKGVSIQNYNCIYYVNYNNYNNYDVHGYVNPPFPSSYILSS